jgi:hypothetical protein
LDLAFFLNYERVKISPDSLLGYFSVLSGISFGYSFKDLNHLSPNSSSTINLIYHLSILLIIELLDSLEYFQIHSESKSEMNDNILYGIDGIVSTNLTEKHHSIIHLIWASFLNVVTEDDSLITASATKAFKLNENCLQIFNQMFDRQSSGISFHSHFQNTHSLLILNWVCKDTRALPKRVFQRLLDYLTSTEFLSSSLMMH